MRRMMFAFAALAACGAGAITATKEYVDRKDATNAAAIAVLDGVVSNHTERLQDIDLRFETTPTFGDVAAVEDKILDVSRGLETNVAHIVSNVVTKSYVEDLGISGGGGGGLTTNDVCAIVTNDAPWWTFSPPSIKIEGELRQIYAELDDIAGDWYVYGGEEEYPLGPVLLPGESSVFRSASDDGEIEITATWSPRNALGLARLEDVPSTNGFVSASITNGLATASITNGLASITDIPTSTSQLVNDSGFISMVTNVFFLNQYGVFEFCATFRINSGTDWLSIDYPGYSTFYYPNSNQVDQAISESITSADTSYRRFVSLTNINQSVQYVETDASVTNIVIQAPATGETKDWIVYVYAATNTTLTLPSGVTWWTADAANTNEIEAAKPTAFYFSQITTNIFYMGRQELTTIGGAQ